jgi:hypothetical protein
MSVINKLTEGIVDRNLGKEGAALLDKWQRTGLLEGLDNDSSRQTLARLLENQAKELLREASSMVAGDVEGFAAVAFPIVRRVFGGLIANELVSVQPMSLPSGLIFFLDFKFSPDYTAANYRDRAGMEVDESLYGGGVVGSQITGGVSLTGDADEDSFYNLSQGFASPTGSIAAVITVVASGTVAAGSGSNVNRTFTSISSLGSKDYTLEELVRYDADLSGSDVVVVTAPGHASWAELSRNNLVGIQISGASGAADAGVRLDTAKYRLVRRLTQLHGRTAAKKNQDASGLDPTNATSTSFIFVFESLDRTSDTSFQLKTHLTGHASNNLAYSFPITDDLTTGGGLGSIVGRANWGLENNPEIPEIDIKVDSVAITAKTKKLKAKWTPELGQDLNAYHNLDAEVELTGILSEQIALEIDREILNDLVQGASAGTYHWSRVPGRFLLKSSGKAASSSANEQLLGYDFTGTVSEWYETLVETINDVSAQIHRKTLRGGANFLVVSPEVANVLEFTSGFRASITADDSKGTVGAVNVGSISKKWDVWVDPYFPRNVILVGRRGSSFLESGYVYAPYVPLQMTPTIFGTEDFVPRKGVMTRYGKKMVRPDMYGLVIVRDLVDAL